MLKRIDPKIKNVVWVSDDSQTVLSLLPRIRRKAESNDLPLNLMDYTLPPTFIQGTGDVRGRP
jgi:hypothetical protein